MADAPHTYEEGTCPNPRCRRKLYLSPSVRVSQCPGCGEGFMARREKSVKPVIAKNDRAPVSPKMLGWMTRTPKPSKG